MKKIILLCLVFTIGVSILTSCSSHTHEFGAWKTTKQPTCTQQGIEERECACGEKQTQYIPTTDHNWTLATCTSPKTCSLCGKTEGSALGHNYINRVCSRCGDLAVPTIKIPTLPATVTAWHSPMTYPATAASRGEIDSVSYIFNKQTNCFEVTLKGHKTYDMYEKVFNCKFLCNFIVKEGDVSHKYYQYAALTPNLKVGDAFEIQFEVPISTFPSDAMEIIMEFETTMYN